MQKQVFLIIYFCISILANAYALASDSLKLKGKERHFATGLFASQQYFASNIYSPSMVSQLGVRASYNCFTAEISPSFLNRALFEKKNYVLGSRDQRKIPLSGLCAGLYYITGASNEKNIHFTVGIQYISTTVYGGWTSLKYFNYFTVNQYSLNRVVNFEDKFYQFDIATGFTFSQKNKLGFAILGHIGRVSQNLSNSHFNFTRRVSRGHYEIEPKSKLSGIYFGASVKLFYNFNLK